MHLATNIAVRWIGICLVASCAAADPAIEVDVASQALCESPNITAGPGWLDPEDGPICTLNVTSPVDTFEYCAGSPGYMSKFEVGAQFRASTVYVGMLNHNKISDGRLCRQGRITGMAICSNVPDGGEGSSSRLVVGARVYNVEPEELNSQSVLVVLTCPPERPFPVSVSAGVQDLGVNNFL